jgi:ribosomal protein S18 acetylase RimI-like enzyme
MHRHFFGQPMLELVMVGNVYRRQGIGEALVRHAISTAPGPTLWTSTNKSNVVMQALLERLGFDRSGIVEGLDEGDPELIYRIATCR